VGGRPVEGPLRGQTMSFWNKLREEAPGVGADVPGAPTIPPHEEPKPMAMLKRDELTSVPTASGDLNALLGRGSEFEGKLTFEGTVRIDGKFNGNVKAKSAVELHHPARMRGNIETPSLMVEKGVVFEGQTKMEGVEKANVKPVPSPSPVQALKP